MFKTFGVLFIFAVISAAAHAQGVGKNDKSEDAIRKVVSQVEAGWNAHDAKTFAGPFAEDADYVVVNGMYIKGREAIDKGHAGIFAGIYKESKNAATIKSIRFLRPDIAVVHVEWNLEFMAGGLKQTARAMNSMIMSETGGKWSIASFHNTPIQPPPGQN